MIRVFYRFTNTDSAPFAPEHSMPVADLAQFELRRRLGRYGLSGAVVTRTEPIDTGKENAAEEYYAKHGTAGEF